MKRKRGFAYFAAVWILFMAVMDMTACGEAEEGGSFVRKFAGKNAEDAWQEETEKKEEREETNGQEQNLTAAGTVKEEYPLLSLEKGKDCFEREDYIPLQVKNEEKSYRVKTGDTLWGIAHDFYGNGNRWPVLKKANAEQVQNENLIFPEEELSIPDYRFIRKQTFSRGGFSSSACSYDAPGDWVVGRPNWEICLEYSWYPEEGNYGVYTHVTRNRIFPEDAEVVWEDMKQKIVQVSKKNGDVLFTAPTFEQYRKEDGSELLFYHFITMTDEQNTQFAVAYVPGKQYLAEFIGICPLTDREEEMCDIVGITRYMAASYREEGGEKEWSSLKYRPYLGEDSWISEDLHNPFAIAESLYGTEEETELACGDAEVRFASEEWEKLLRDMVCYHFEYSGEQKREFMERPIYLSELAWIRDVALIESPIPGRDQIAIQGLSPSGDAGCADYHLTTLADIAVLPNLQTLTLEIGTATDYEMLAACPSLKELAIAGQEEIRKPFWLLKLPNLESLTLKVSNIPHLLAMGIEMEGGTTFLEGEEKETQKKEKDENKVMEEILAQCTSLTYLELEHTGEMDYSFLEKLPKLYAFILSGEDEEAERADEFMQVTGPKCLVVDGQWLRNPA